MKKAKEFLNKINWPAVITTAVVILYCTKTCSTINSDTSCDRVDTVIKIEKQVFIDTVIKEVSTEPVVKTEYVYMPSEPVDTMSILRDYYTMRSYTDTVSDSCFQVIINDTVFKNSILGRNVISECYQKREVITKTEKITVYPAEKPYISAGVASSFRSFHGSIYYTRNKNTFGVGYDPFYKSLIFSYQYKIKFNEKDSKN